MLDVYGFLDVVCVEDEFGQISKLLHVVNVLRVEKVLKINKKFKLNIIY